MAIGEDMVDIAIDALWEYSSSKNILTCHRSRRRRRLRRRVRRVN